MVVIALDYARNDGQHPMARRSEEPQRVDTGVRVLLVSRSQDARVTKASDGAEYMKKDAQRASSQACAGRVDRLEAACPML